MMWAGAFFPLASRAVGLRRNEGQYFSRPYPTDANLKMALIVFLYSGSWLLYCIKNVIGSGSRINTCNIKRWFLAFLENNGKGFSASTFYNDFFSSRDVEYFRKPFPCFRICINLHNIYSKIKMPISRAILCMPESKVINGHFKLSAHSKKYASYA